MTREQRRLTAIISADVVGYSRLMSRDEGGTLAALKAHLRELIDPKIAEYGGRTVKSMGDGLLLEFPSVVDAVRCAVDVQRGMVERNAGVPGEQQIQFRVGTNVGDIIIDGDDIFGDGVNVAARLQTLAEPNGISISGAVYEQIRNKVDLAFRDLGEQSLKNINDPIRVYQVLPFVRPGDADLSQEERNYRDSIKHRYAEDAGYYVPLSGTTTDAAPAQGNRGPRSVRRAERRARVEYHEWIALGDDIKQVRLDDLRGAVEKYACIILLGDPGCGKSTAIEALAFEHADRPERIPVVLHLGGFVAGISLEEFIVQGLSGSPQAGQRGAPGLGGNLKAYLEAGKLLLLFDALNEMPLEGYRDHCAALRRFIDAWSTRGNRFVVTCRRLDYGEELSGLQRIEVQAMRDDQIELFLRNELPQRWHALWQALQSDDGGRRLLELARIPYFLTIMIDVFERDGELGKNRAELMQRFTEIMLESAKTKCPLDKWLDAELQSEALSVMAFEMQARSGFGTRVKTEQIKTVMPHQLQRDPNWPAEQTPPDQVLTLAASASIVEMPVDRLTVRFCHQLLQEYFAARRMVKQDPATLANLWRSPWLETDMPAWSRPEDNHDPLPPPPSTGWEETTILAASMASASDSQFLRALLQINPVLAGRCLLQSGGNVDADLRQTLIAKLLAGIGNRDVALRVRIAAGGVLGQLGDPRLGQMATIPAGNFIMGEGSDRHERFLPEYQIGKYPITNSEYRRFIDAGGYTNKRWWTEAGWVEVGQRQSEPSFWQNTRFNKPSQPAMGLSWYECVAYCRWLSAETGRLWRLPTEAEWEKGARGSDGRLYPWGNEFDPGALNGRGPRDRQVCTSTPVGMYPMGISPLGLFDCVGNVWEWCTTRWKKPFPYDTEQNEWESDYLQGQTLRALRGGSWYDSKDVTRCAHRFRFQPFGWSDRGGFRLVSPA